MRPTLLLLATAASCVSATQLGCPQHLFEKLVARMSCGDKSSISKCLTSNTDLTQLNEIEQCYIAGGCSNADARMGAVRFAHEYQAEVRDEVERDELRRRADSSDTTSDSAIDKATSKTSAKTTAKRTSAETTESSAAAPSTSTSPNAAASTTSDSTTSVSTAPSTTATTASSTTSSASTGQVTTTGALLCSTTNTIQTSYCLVTSGTTASCVPTTTLVTKCAAGNLCMTNPAGENTCMKIDNTVGAGGIIIAIVFGSAIAAVAVGIIVMNHKTNRAQHKREAQQAAFMAGYPKSKAADMEAFRDGQQVSEANLPLISEPGQHAYGGQEVLDHGRRAPQLHQGLGALS